MADLLSGIRYHGRLLELPHGSLHDRLSVLIGERIVQLGVGGVCLEGIHPGDLIAFAVHPPQTSGAPAQAAPPDAVLPEMAAIERLGGPLPGGRWSGGDALRWRHPGRSPARLALLRLRHSVLRAVRAHFDEQGFVEVETPAYVRAPSPEPQFAPLAVEEGFLITSPEFQLKRLLVGGMERIYRIGAAYRGGESGRLHNPEFALLEWYRTDAGTEALAADLHALLVRLVPLAEEFSAAHGLNGGAGAPRLLREWVGAPLPQVTVAELFRRHLGIDLRGVVTAGALLAAAREARWTDAGALPEAFDAAFSRLWIDVETSFPKEPFLVTEWPAPVASLARLKPGDPTVADRMELYAGGLELANGFAELIDAAEQRARFEANLVARDALGLSPLPLDEAFLRALEDGMPPSAGMALGIDRLVMLVAGVADIRDVLSFASDEL